MHDYLHIHALMMIDWFISYSCVHFNIDREKFLQSVFQYTLYEKEQVEEKNLICPAPVSIQLLPNVRCLSVFTKKIIIYIYTNKTKETNTPIRIDDPTKQIKQKKTNTPIRIDDPTKQSNHKKDIARTSFKITIMMINNDQ